MEEMGLAKRSGLSWCGASQKKAMGLVRGFSKREVNWLFGEPGGVHGSSSRLAGENECPEGTPIGSQYGCNRHLQAYLCREVEDFDFEIVDKKSVKAGFSDTLLIRATVRLSRCAGWLGLLCCAERLLAFSISEGQSSRARAAGMWRTWAIRSSRF
jgi:hypothetical protein